MTDNHQDLIAQLVDDLEPVKPPKLARAVLGWITLSWLWVVVITLALGPLRPGALQQLTQNPHFLLETTAGFVAIALLGWSALASSIPATLSAGPKRIALGLLALWLASYAAGFVLPAVEPSMLGKRPHCFAETLLYAAVPLVGGVALAWRGHVLQPIRTGVLLGLTAGMMPALFMQLACMYATDHILVFHILPGLLVGAAAALAAFFAPPRSVSTT